MALLLLTISLLAAPAFAQTFGKGVNLSAATPVSALLDDPEAFVGQTLQIKGLVVEVCALRGCWMNIAGDPLPINITEDEVARVASIEGLEAVPLITVKTGVNNNPVAITGVPVDQMKAFKEWRINNGRYFASPQDEGILVDARLAHDERLSIGDTFRVRGTEMPIIGIAGCRRQKFPCSLLLATSLG